jgi:hypothetical protein
VVWDRIVTALAYHGIELVPETNRHGAGARWILPRDGRTQKSA